MRKTQYAIFLLLGACAGSAHAGLYQCVDANGKHIFRDQPCANATRPATAKDQHGPGGTFSSVAPSQTLRARQPMQSDLVNSANRRIAEMDRADAREREINQLVDVNEAQKTRLSKDNPSLYKRLEAVSGGDLSHCTVVGDSSIMKSHCMK